MSVKEAKPRGGGEPEAETASRNGAKSEKPRRATRFSAAVDSDELEFIQAIDRFKRDKNRPFPSWSEILSILKGLGYRKAE